MPERIFQSAACRRPGCLAFASGYLALPQAIPAGSENEPAVVLHVESHKAAIDLVARDSRNLPIASLTADELMVYEIPKHGAKFRGALIPSQVDPERKDQSEELAGVFHVTSGAVCALDCNSSLPDSIQASADPGFHTVLVKTTRPHVHLTFRRQYFVGHTRENATAETLKKLVTPTALQEAACYHPVTPATLALTASVLDIPGRTSTRYAVTIKPESLADVGIHGAIPRVQLDFGMCIFDSDGEVANYLHSTVDHQLNAADMARLVGHGFLSFLEAPGVEAPAMARVAVLDRNTGNVGIVDVSRPLPIAAQTKQREKKREAHRRYSRFWCRHAEGKCLLRRCLRASNSCKLP